MRENISETSKEVLLKIVGVVKFPNQFYTKLRQFWIFLISPV